jgi:hypothetical protein
MFSVVRIWVLQKKKVGILMRLVCFFVAKFSTMSTKNNINNYFGKYAAIKFLVILPKKAPQNEGNFGF